jgi:hypothetical protein
VVRLEMKLFFKSGDSGNEVSDSIDGGIATSEVMTKIFDGEEVVWSLASAQVSPSAINLIEKQKQIGCRIWKKNI